MEIKLQSIFRSQKYFLRSFSDQSDEIERHKKLFIKYNVPLLIHVTLICIILITRLLFTKQHIYPAKHQKYLHLISEIILVDDFGTSRCSLSDLKSLV